MKSRSPVANMNAGGSRAKPAGGRGLGTEKKGKGKPLFADTKDANYAAMLQAIEEGRQKMLAVPRVDMQAQAQKK